MTQINLTRPTGGDLIIYGKRADGTPSLRDGFAPPMPVPVVEYAPEAKFLNGETAVGVRTPNALCVLPVRIVAADETGHQAIVAAWQAALRHRGQQLTIVHFGHTSVWKTKPGQIVLANNARIAPITGQPVYDYYRVTIPVHPIPVS